MLANLQSPQIWSFSYCCTAHCKAQQSHGRRTGKGAVGAPALDLAGDEARARFRVLLVALVDVLPAARDRPLAGVLVALGLFDFDLGVKGLVVSQLLFTGFVYGLAGELGSGHLVLVIRVVVLLIHIKLIKVITMERSQ